MMEPHRRQDRSGDGGHYRKSPARGRVVSVLATVIAAATVPGCSDDGPAGQPVGCEWFEGYNCWKGHVESAAECAHDSSTPGTLSADGRTCTFADGTAVHFERPLNLDYLDDHEWVFEITVNGAFCLSYANTDEGLLELETGAGRFEERMQGASVEITCPDQSRYRVPDALLLLDCEDALDNLPGHTVTWTSTELSFNLSGRGSTEGPMHLFHCVLP